MHAIGIDFGTSTTEVALYQGGRPRLIADADGEEVVASVVAFPPSGRPLVGRRARARRLLDPGNTIESVKRVVGLPFFAKEVAEYRDSHPYEMEPGEDGQPRIVTRAGALSPCELVAEILRAVRRHPDLPTPDRVVLTAPAGFEPRQRDGLVEAARLAGLGEVSLVDEAYAAALPYLRPRGPRERVFVYDLGGGTFDAALLEVEGLAHRVLGYGGDPYLGGDDVDRALADHVVTEVLRHHQWDLRTSPQALLDLRLECERAKMRLSRLEEAVVDLSLVDPVLQGRRLVLDRPALAQAIHALVQRSFAVVDDVLRSVGLDARQVDRVILAGGSTCLPSVLEAVKAYFGRDPETALPPDRLVAMGAALQAAGVMPDRVDGLGAA